MKFATMMALLGMTEANLVTSGMQRPYITNENRPLDQVRESADLYKGDQSGRKTDTMGEIDKHYEDNWNQGMHNTGTQNSPVINSWHKLPNAWDKMGPTNQPGKFLYPKDFQKPGEFAASESGIYLTYFTVDTSEHAFRYIKDLFAAGLCPDASFEEQGIDRSYLKFGRLSTDPNRVRVQVTVPTEKVNPLIEYINEHNPSSYDYPVQDVYVVPVQNANTEYVKWINEQANKKIDYKEIYKNYPKEDQPL